MATTSSPSLSLSSPRNTASSSCMTLLSEMRLPLASISCSPIPTISPNCIQQSSCLGVQKGHLSHQPARNLPARPRANPKSATNLISGPVKTQTLSASTDTSAKGAKNPDMQVKIARKGASEIYGLQPKYLRHNLWEDTPTLSPTTAEWTECATPLPRIPLAEVSNPVACKTIADNPALFQIISPINMNAFEVLLEHHPNPLFVRSVCVGICEGFWPWADTL
jgi:hypothetical protein